MSIDTCRCGRFVDTDDDPDAYSVETEDCEMIMLDYCLCPSCREDFQGLLELKKKTEAFRSEIFDWVRCVDDMGILERLYEFEQKIEKLTEARIK